MFATVSKGSGLLGSSGVPEVSPPEATGPALELQKVIREAGLPLALLLRLWRLATAAPQACFLFVADAEVLAEIAAPIDLEGVSDMDVELWPPSAARRRRPFSSVSSWELLSDPQPALVDVVVPVAGQVV